MHWDRLFLGGALLTAACGSDGGFADARPADGDGDAADAVDAGSDADPHGVVTVTVYTQAGGPLPDVNARVVFTDGERTQVVATDSAGIARATVLPGATVTAVRTVEDPVRITTILDVTPGDEIVVGSRLAASAPLGDHDIEFAAFGSAASYSASAGCGTGTSAGRVVSLPVSAQCGPGPHDILLVARDGSDVVLGSASALDVPFPPTGGVAITADQWQPASRLDAMLTGIPDVVDRLTVQHAVVHDGKTYAASTTQALRTGGAQLVSVAFPTFAGAEASIVTTVTDDKDQMTQQIRERRPTATSYGLQVDTALLPWVRGLGFDAGGRGVSWQRSPETGGDGVVFLGSYRRPDQRAVIWFVAAPPATTTLTLPDLPPELGALEPTAATDFAVALVGIVDASNHDGYPSFRETAEPDFASQVQLERFRFSATTVSARRVAP
jgi:hypothetical protein